MRDPPGKACNRPSLPSGLRDGDARVLLVGPLAVVMLPGALRLALEAPHVLLLDYAAMVVEGHAGVLLSAGVVLRGGLALLVLHDMGVHAAGARVLDLRRHQRGEREKAEHSARGREHL